MTAPVRVPTPVAPMEGPITTPVKQRVQQIETQAHPSPVFDSPGRPGARVAASESVTDARYSCVHCHDAKAKQMAVDWLRSSERRAADTLGAKQRAVKRAVRSARAVLATGDAQGTLERVLAKLECIEEVKGASQVLRDAAEREIHASSQADAAREQEQQAQKVQKQHTQEVQQLQRQLSQQRKRAEHIEEQLRQMEARLQRESALCSEQRQQWQQEIGALQARQVDLEQQLLIEQQQRQNIEEEAGEAVRQADDERQRITKRYEEVLVAHRDALGWLGSVGEAAPAPQLEDKGAEKWTGVVTVTIEHRGHLGIEFTTDSSGRIVVSTVDPTSHNATAASQSLQRGQQLLSVQSRKLDSFSWPTMAQHVQTQRPLVLTFAPPADLRAQLQIIALPRGFPRVCAQVENIKSMEAQLDQACAFAEKIRSDLVATRIALAHRVRVVRMMQTRVRVALPMWKARRQKTQLLTDRPDNTTRKYRCLKSARLRQAAELSSRECGKIAVGDIVTVNCARTQRIVGPRGETVERLCIVSSGAAGPTAVRGFASRQSFDGKTLFVPLDAPNVPDQKPTPSRRPRVSGTPQRHSQTCHSAPAINAVIQEGEPPSNHGTVDGRSHSPHLTDDATSDAVQEPPLEPEPTAQPALSTSEVGVRTLSPRLAAAVDAARARAAADETTQPCVEPVDSVHEASSARPPTAADQQDNISTDMSDFEPDEEDSEKDTEEDSEEDSSASGRPATNVVHTTPAPAPAPEPEPKMEVSPSQSVDATPARTSTQTELMKEYLDNRGLTAYHDLFLDRKGANCSAYSSR